MVHLLQHFSPLRNPVPGRRRIALLGGCLLALIAGYSVFIPFSWTQPQGWQWWFWQWHALVFAGTIVVLAVTLVRLPAWQPRRYRIVCGALIGAHILTILASIFNISWYDTSAGSPFMTWNLPFYLIIYTVHTFGLVAVVPLFSLPRMRVLQLATETLLVSVLVDVVLRVLLPALVPSWLWTPDVQALELRLVSSVAVSFWYVRAYYRLAAFRGGFVVLWGLGLLAMMCTDLLFLLGTLSVVLGGPDHVFSFAIPFWDMHQVLWALGLFWAFRTPLQWRTINERTASPSKPTWWIVARQSSLLVGLVLISSGIVSSPLSLVWLICALVMHESLGMYEREHLIAMQRRTQADLQTANRQLALQAAQAEQLTAIEERTRIARELHDGVCQSLNAASMQLAVCEYVVVHEPQRVAQELLKVQRLVADGQTEARQTIHALRDPSAFAQPLPIVIQPLIDELHAAGIATTPTVLGTPRVLNPHATWELFRAVGEALTNVRKHAAATAVEVVLDYQLPAAFRLTIRDNGCGTRNPVYGTGLIGMRERVALLGGALRIVTAPQQGWMLIVEVPG